MNRGIIMMVMGLALTGLPCAGGVERIETVEHRIVRERDERLEAVSEAELRYHTDRVELVEVWRTVGEPEVRFEVTFARDTFHPLRWVRMTKAGEIPIRTELTIEDEAVVTRHYRGDAPAVRHSMPVPDGLFTVPPMVKLVLPHVVRATPVPEGFQHVLVNDDGTMRVVSLVLQVYDGEEQVEVPGGTFRCRRVSLNPASRAVSLIVPPAQVHVPIKGPAVMVRTAMRQTRLGALNITELTGYTARDP